MFKNRILKFETKKNRLPMKTNPPKQYESPVIRVLEIKFEGIVCQSLTGTTSGGLPEGSEDNDIDD